MKKPASKGGGSSGGGHPKHHGRHLTDKQLREAYRNEAKKSRKEATHARTEAKHAREEAAHAGQEAARQKAEEAKDKKEGFNVEAQRHAEDARKDLAREHRDLARASRDMARGRRDDARAKRDLGKARTVGLARAVSPGGWILGGNDRYESCAATAVANTLLLATGRRLSDHAVLDLHHAAGGTATTGVQVPAVLEAANLQLSGLKLGSALPRSKSAWICELDIEQAQFDQDMWDAEPSPWAGVHAAVIAGGHAIVWGHAIPVTARFLARQVTAAWAVTWTT